MKKIKILIFSSVFVITACCPKFYTGKYAEEARQEFGIDTLYVKDKIWVKKTCYPGDSIKLDSKWYKIKYYK